MTAVACSDEPITNPVDWIPVEEALPIAGQTVLAYEPVSGIMILDYKNGPYQWCDTGSLLEMDGVTHWTVLPPAPEGI